MPHLEKPISSKEGGEGEGVVPSVVAGEVPGLGGMNELGGEK